MPGQRRNILSGVIVALVVAVASLAVVVPAAFAWEPVKSSNGVVLSRSIDDTVAVAVSRYSQYKGGDDWHTLYWPWSSSSYTSSTVLFSSVATSVGSVELGLDQSGGRCQMIRLGWTVGGSNQYEYFALYNEPVAVSIQNTGSVDVTFTPRPTETASVSVVGTLPVSVESLGDFDSRGLGILGAVGSVLCGVALGKAVIRG